MLTEQQRQERKKGIGGSDVAAIMGASKYKTAIDIYMEKTTDYEPQFTPEQKFNMDVGNAMEPVIVGEFIRRTGLPVAFVSGAYLHKEFPYLFANLDGVVTEDEFNLNPLAVLEAKTARTKTEEWGEGGTNIIPIEYLYQVAHYCMVSCLEKAYVSVWFKQSNEIVDYIYHRDLKLESLMLERLCDFWENHVQKGIMPPVMKASDVKWVYEDVEVIKVPIEETETILNIEKYKVINSRIKVLESEKSRVRDSIISSLGGFGKIVNWNDEKIGSFKKQITNRLDIDRLRIEQPDIYSMYLERLESTRLCIK